MIDRISRRGALIGATSSTLLAARPSVANATDNGLQSRAEGQIKMVATLDESPAIWAYAGIVYAVRPALHPTAILAVAGCQAQWAKRLPDGSYRLGAVTLSFFRDLKTGAFLDQFDNPITGQRNAVKPNFLSGGTAIYPADGSSARAEGQVKDAVVAPNGFKAADPALALGGVRWNLIGSSIMLMTDRSWNVARQPQLEAQTQSADRVAFFDDKISRLPARYTGTTIIPWMTFLEMGETPGHLVWHTSGEKLFSFDGLPGDYRAKAGDMLDKLETKPDL